MSIHMRLEGIELVERDLLSRADPVRLYAVVSETAYAVHRRAIENLDREVYSKPETAGPRTGALRNSLKVEAAADVADGVGFEVFSDLEYAKYVEYGTGQRGAESPLPWREPEIEYTGSWPGMAARPFLHPAMIEEEEPFKTKLREAISR